MTLESGIGTVLDLETPLYTPGCNPTGEIVHMRHTPRFVGFWALFVLFFALILASCGREAPTYAPGDITVISTPTGASIFIDGVDTGEVTPHTFQGLDVNLYNVSVELTNFVASPGVVPVAL